jgi:hypothetical protein
MSEERQETIVEALRNELRRQAAERRPAAPQIGPGSAAQMAAISGEVDLTALAVAIDAALGADTLDPIPQPAGRSLPPGAGSSPKGAYAKADEGMTPDELDASNDE